MIVSNLNSRNESVYHINVLVNLPSYFTPEALSRYRLIYEDVVEYI